MGSADAWHFCTRSFEFCETNLQVRKYHTKTLRMKQFVYYIKSDIFYSTDGPYLT